MMEYWNNGFLDLLFRRPVPSFHRSIIPFRHSSTEV